MSSPHASTTGVQRPRVSWVPPSSSSRGDLVADFAARFGLVLDDWQRYVLNSGMGLHDQGGWQARNVTAIVPRQNGKGSIIEARELAGLFLFGESCVHTAHEVKTARKAFHRLRRLVEAAPPLMAKVKAIRQANGQESIELKDGTLIEFIARSKGSGRGFTAPLLILDEAMILTDEAMEALTYIQGTFGTDAQTWFFGSAPLVESEVLRRICEAGAVGGDPRSAYMEWSKAAEFDLDDRRGWAQANPALGIRLTEQTLIDERTGPGSTERGFARERLGVADHAAGANVIGRDLWDAVADTESQAVGGVALAIDVSPDQDHGAVAVAGRREDGRVHVEVVEALPGDGWIVGLVARVVAAQDTLTVTLDVKSPAAALIPALEDAGVTVDVTKMADVPPACAGLFSDVVNGALRHRPAPVLNAAVLAAGRRPLGEGWAWKRRGLADDITPLVAVTLARHAFLTAAPPEERSVYESRDMVIM